MGYRSDVRIRTNIKGFEVMKQTVKEYLKTNLAPNLDLKEYDYNLLNHLDYKKEIGNEITIGWNYLKWYEGDYIDVNAIMYAIGKLEENDIPFSYARIGEEYDDIVEKYYESTNGDYVDYISIIRQFDDDDLANDELPF